jgi:hypothetical protein
MKMTSEEIAAQTAAFLSSGNEVETIEPDKPKVAQARYYNTTDRIVFNRIRRDGQRVTGGKLKAMQSTRGGYML